MATVTKSKLVVKNIGNPRAVTALPQGQDKLFLGTMMGVAEKLIARADAAGNMFTGLAGTFEGIPSDPNMDTIKSGVCFLPAGIMEMISTPLAEAAEKGEAIKVGFAFECYSLKATNAAGYEYGFESAADAQAVDPLAELRAKRDAFLAAKASKTASVEDKTAAKTK